MRRRGIGFEVIPRSFHDEKETIPASLQPRVLTAIYGPGLKRFDAKRWSACDAGRLKGSAKEKRFKTKTREGTATCPMPSPATMSASTSRRPAAERRSFS